jgi:hypothetical protein
MLVAPAPILASLILAAWLFFPLGPLGIRGRTEVHQCRQKKSGQRRECA